MNKGIVASILSILTVAAAVVSTQASAVSIVNRDATPQSVQYVEDSEAKTVEVDAGQETSVCEEGCVLTFNGTSMDVTGEESLEIVGGMLQAVK